MAMGGTFRRADTPKSTHVQLSQRSLVKVPARMAEPSPPVEKPSAGDKLRYQVDRFLSWSPLARFVGLFGLSFLLISVNAIAVRFLMPPEDDKAFGVLDGFWWATTRV